jgi:hypothetical protein
MKFDRFSFGLVALTLTGWSDLPALAQQVNVEARAGPKGMAWIPAGEFSPGMKPSPKAGDDVFRRWHRTLRKQLSQRVYEHCAVCRWEKFKTRSPSVVSKYLREQYKNQVANGQRAGL